MLRVRATHCPLICHILALFPGWFQQELAGAPLEERGGGPDSWAPAFHSGSPAGAPRDALPPNANSPTEPWRDNAIEHVYGNAQEISAAEPECVNKRQIRMAALDAFSRNSWIAELP